MGHMIAPTGEMLLTLSGNDTNHPVEDVIIDSIAIHHGAALFISNAKEIIISDIEISHTGSYGL